MTIKEILQIIFILFFAMVVHEYAHAWMANRLGDPTAKLAGRMTLNPLRHIDPFGTIWLPIILTALRFMGSPFLPIALAKPVPVNFLRLHNPKRDMIWVGLAGPAVNIVIAVAISVCFRFGLFAGAQEWLAIALYINLILAVFNMIPIPPLDGSRLVMGLLPAKIGAQYGRLERYGVLIVFALLPMGLFHKVVQPISVYCAYLLGVQF